MHQIMSTETASRTEPTGMRVARLEWEKHIKEKAVRNVRADHMSSAYGKANQIASVSSPYGSMMFPKNFAASPADPFERYSRTSNRLKMTVPRLVTMEM